MANRSFGRAFSKSSKALGKGWHQESHRHRLARLGVKTTSDIEKRIRNEELYINRNLFPREADSSSKYFLPKEELKKKYPRKELLTIVLRKDKAHLLDFLKGYTYLDSKGRWMKLDEDNIQFDIEYLDTADKRRTKQLLKEFRGLNNDMINEDLFYVRVIPIEASSLNYKRGFVSGLDYAGESELINYSPLTVNDVQAEQQSQQKPVPPKVKLLEKGWVGRGLRAEAKLGGNIMKGAGSLLGTAVQGIFYEPERDTGYSPQQLRVFASHGYYPQLRDPDYAKHGWKKLKEDNWSKNVWVNTNSQKKIRVIHIKGEGWTIDGVRSKIFNIKKGEFIFPSERKAIIFARKWIKKHPSG